MLDGCCTSSFPAPAEPPVGESAVRDVAGQMETASCASDIQPVAESGDGSSDPSLSSEEDMPLETEAEDGAELSELAAVTAGPSSTHTSAIRGCSVQSFTVAPADMYSTGELSSGLPPQHIHTDNGVVIAGAVHNTRSSHMVSDIIHCTQLNVQHSRAGTANLSTTLCGMH